MAKLFCFVAADLFIGLSMLSGLGATRALAAEADSPPNSAASVGVFDANNDVGTVLHAGSTQYDPKTKAYEVAGSGENMWFAVDDFQFAWKKVAGDITITADISMVGSEGDNHRKAVLMIRQSLLPDAAYADAALHGDGLTSLQFRESSGATTHEVQANVTGPTRIRLMKRGFRFYMWTASGDMPFKFAGGSTMVPITGAYYVGIGVCAHNKDAVQRAIFSNVEIATGSQPKAKPAQYKTLETVAVASTDARAVYVTTDMIESPNWSPDGKTLLFNTHDGKVGRVPAGGGKADVIQTGLKCYASHGISPDGSQLAVTAKPPGHRGMAIYIVPVTGGEPRVLVSKSPSLFAGWSPDGGTIAFNSAENRAQGIYTVPSAGGAMKRVSTTHDFEEGGEFSPDGKFLYFASNHHGVMQIWRMNADGSDPRPMASDLAFGPPHVSPNGEMLAFLSYSGSNRPFPAYEDVELRMVTLADGKVKLLAKLVGGQGTIDSPSWSPDSKRVAFVSYQWIH